MSARAIVDRMRSELDVKSDAEMARVLGLSAGTPSAWVRRGSVPQRYLAEVSARTNAAVDWLLTGEGESKKEGYPARLYVMPELLEVAICVAERTKASIDRLKGVSISQLAVLVEKEYDRASRLFHEFERAGLDKETALEAIRRSSDMPEESRLVDWVTGEPYAPSDPGVRDDRVRPMMNINVSSVPPENDESDPNKA